MKGLILFGRKKIVELEKQLKEKDALLKYDEQVIEELRTTIRGQLNKIDALWEQNATLKKKYDDIMNKTQPRDSKGKFVKKTNNEN